MNAQEDIWNYESIGFAYSRGANKSTILLDAERQIQDQHYDSIVALLESESIADQFVGSILCPILAEHGKIDLSDSQTQKIQSIRNSPERLLFKYGCTCREVESLNKFFRKYRKPCRFRQGIKKWKKHLVEKYF